MLSPQQSWLLLRISIDMLAHSTLLPASLSGDRDRNSDRRTCRFQSLENRSWRGEETVEQDGFIGSDGRKNCVERNGSAFVTQDRQQLVNFRRGLSLVCL